MYTSWTFCCSGVIAQAGLARQHARAAAITDFAVIISILPCLIVYSATAIVTAILPPAISIVTPC
jgi:uncharacterized membrane protein